MHTIILGDGHLGWAIAAAAGERGERIPIIGRPAFDRHDRTAVLGADIVIDASQGPAVRANVETGLEAGVRRFVIATTGWDAARASVDQTLRSGGASAVVAPNLAPGAAVFLRLVEDAAALAAAMTRLRKPARPRQWAASSPPSSNGTAGPRPTARPGRPGS